MPDSPFSFPCRYRLRRKQDFQFVFDKPYRIKQKYLLALYRVNDQSDARLGIILSKSHLKRAVDRNRLKRIIRESFRLNRNKLNAVDIVILLREGPRAILQKKNTDVLQGEINKIWQVLIKS